MAVCTPISASLVRFLHRACIESLLSYECADTMRLLKGVLAIAWASILVESALLSRDVELRGDLDERGACLGGSSPTSAR